jgi:hypothetical protein
MPRRTKHPNWASMDADERASYLRDARRRGGQTRAAQESAALARSKGFWVTMETHPFFARKWLRHRIASHNQVKACEHNLSVTEYRFQRQRSLQITYIRLSGE